MFLFSVCLSLLLFTASVRADDVLFDLPTLPHLGETIQTPGPQQGASTRRNGPVLYYFSSKSVGQPSILRTWSELRRQTSLPIVTVLRGTNGQNPNELLNDMVGLPNPISRTHNTPPIIWIDPILFQRYQITQVPAWVLVLNLDPSELHRHPQRAYRLVGDLKLREVLERFQTAIGPGAATGLDQAITELSTTWWEQKTRP